MTGAEDVMAGQCERPEVVAITHAVRCAKPGVAHAERAGTCGRARVRLVGSRDPLPVRQRIREPCLDQILRGRLVAAQDAGKTHQRRATCGHVRLEVHPRILAQLRAGSAVIGVGLSL